MPYNSLSDLPDNVKEHVPKHGQEIYLAAFNSAYDEYKNPEDRQDDSGREETAHKVAWSAVTQSYEKRSDGDWHEK